VNIGPESDPVYVPLPVHPDHIPAAPAPAVQPEPEQVPA
jgi:hypothetical protein